MYFSARSSPSPRGSGTASVTGTTIARVGAPGDQRRERGGVDLDLLVEARAVVGLAARASAAIATSVGRRRAAHDPLEGRLVGRDHAGAAAALDRHVADRHPALHREALDHRAGVLDHVAGGAVGAHLADRAEDQVLRRDAEAELARVGDPHRLRLALGEALRGEHVLDLAGADAEGERAEGAVGGGVRVAADDRHARLRDAQLRPDHVHDPLAGGADRVERDAELLAVALERLAPARARARRGSARRPACRRSARCGRRWPACGRAGGPAGRRAAGRRRPAALVTSCTRCRSM